MTCRELNEHLIDYRSGDLTPQKRADFEAHLGWCADCVEYTRSYAETIWLSKHACSHPANQGSPDVPDELVQAILAVRLQTWH